MMKSKAFSIINIFGLAVGLTCCLLITVYLRYEWSYDSYQKGVDDLYQIATEFTMSGKQFTLRSEEHTSELSHLARSRMPSSA